MGVYAVVRANAVLLMWFSMFLVLVLVSILFLDDIHLGLGS